MWDRRGEVSRLVARTVASAVGAVPFTACAHHGRGVSSQRWVAESAGSWFHLDRVGARARCTPRIGLASFATRADVSNDVVPLDTSNKNLKGITVRKNGRVSVRISGGGVPQQSLGTFDSLALAIEAYDAHAVTRGVPTQQAHLQQLRSTVRLDKATESVARHKVSATESAASVVPSTRKKTIIIHGATTKNPRSSAAMRSDAREASDLRMHKQSQARYLSETAQAICSTENPTPDAIVANVMDMRNPGRWYPAARGMRREIHLHVGPTNSGKTWHAVNKLKEAESGVYCSPLRLLAWEVAESINSSPEALMCNLVTGQEKKTIVGSKHTACTVEMCDTNKVVDVAVVDEAHLLGDPSRGYAFSRAVFGLPAKELHLCGDPAMVPLIETIATELGESLTIHRYDRLQPLRVLKQPLRKIKDVQPGDCLVAFSRKAVHALKKDVELEAGKRACVIYGSLPPEARARQAELFNDRVNSGYDVLIASDAIGMGLNLSIKRVVFTTLKKYDGENLRNLSPPEVKQIAGRAGRFGMGSSSGGATTMRKDDLLDLRKAVNASVVSLTKASIAPTLDQIALYHEAKPEVSLPDALKAFFLQAKPSKHYFPRKCEDMIAAAELVAHLDLTLEDHWMFAVAPCSAEDLDGPGSKALVTFAEAFVKRGRVSVRTVLAPKFTPPKTQGELSVLEQAHASYDLYLWFSLRCPVAFPEHDYAQALRKTCAAAIELGLQRSSTKKLRESAKHSVGWVDEDKLARAVADVARLERELELDGFGSGNDPDGVYGSVTFAPGGYGRQTGGAGGGKATKASQGRATRRFREKNEKASSGQKETRRAACFPGAREKRDKPKRPQRVEVTRSAVTNTKKTPEVKPKTSKPSKTSKELSGVKTTTNKAAKQQNEKAPVASTATAKKESERLAETRLKTLRAAKGYPGDFSGPAVTRHAEKETSTRNALFGSIMRLAGVTDVKR